MVFSGVFSPLMNCIKPSSNIDNTSPIPTDMRSKHSSGLKYYASSCENDSDLKNFDSSLQQRTTSVMNLFADQADSQSIPQGSVMEVYEFLLDLNRDVVREIIERREDVMENKDLTSLIHLYFKNTTKTLDFCNTVENCVKRAEVSQLIIRYAVKQFEAESVDTDTKKKNKYAKTLEELNKFKAMGDPFDGEFLTQHNSVCEEQVLLLEELGKLRARLDKKQRNLKIWRRLSNVVFITAFVSVLVLSVAAAAFSGPLVLAAVAGGLAPPIEVVGKWCSEMWEKYEKAVKRQKGLVSAVERRARVNTIATENIRLEADSLRIKLKFILRTAEFPAEREDDEEATRLAMQEIKDKVEGLTEKIKEVGQHAAKFSEVIALGRLLVLNHILSLPSNSVS